MYQLLAIIVRYVLSLIDLDTIEKNRRKVWARSPINHRESKQPAMSINYGRVRILTG